MGECFFWYRPTRVVPDQRPLNGRCCLLLYVIMTYDRDLHIKKVNQHGKNLGEGCLVRYYPDTCIPTDIPDWLLYTN